jgi:DNA-directed RNA polymerase specialized sigma24 family protein
MARQRRQRKMAPEDDANNGGVPAGDKIARLLGMLLVKDLKTRTEQVPLLRSAGFSISEIADMLSMAENHVRVADHHGRKRKK